MRRFAFVGAVGLSACGVVWDAPEPPSEPAVVAHVGDGWALDVPDGAKVAVSAGAIAVDAPDGSWWFDIRRLPVSEPRLPIAVATRWGEERCLPLRFDQPVTPVEGVWTVGGTCSIGQGRYWMQVVLVQDGDMERFVGLMGQFGRVHYEDLWIDLFRTALTLRSGDGPGRAVDLVALREAVRATHFDDPRGLLPVPGGGVFSGEVARSIGETWTHWRDADVPTTFTPRMQPQDAPAAPGSCPADAR